MSVSELLSSSQDRSGGVIDYVDENGDICAGSMGDDAMERPVEEEALFSQAKDMDMGKVAIREAYARESLLEEIEAYADKRGIPYVDAAAAFGVDLQALMGIGNPVTCPVAPVETKTQQKSRPRPRGRESMSGRDMTYHIEQAQSEASRLLGRSLTDEEMIIIANDVMRGLRP